MTNWSSLPLRARIYVSFVVIAAAPIFFLALRNVFLSISIKTEPYWLLLTAITLITVPIFVKDPHVRSLVTIGDAYVISICMKFEADRAIVANVLYIGFLALLLRRRLNTTADKITFNIAIAVINVFLYGWVFEKLKTVDPILLPTFGLAVSFFISNSFFIATAISLSTKTKLLDVWRKNYFPLAHDFLLSAFAGAIIVFILPKVLPIDPSIGSVLVAPFVGAVWIINKINRDKALLNQDKALQAQRHLKEQEQLYLRTVETLALAVDAKDQTTYGHIRRVRAYALGLAKLVDITNENELRAIETGSLLHDIGKLAIEDYILNKPGRLSKQEFEKMKLHATAGDEILRQVQFPFPVAKYVRCHHERWDGKGYPDGLRGEDIPIGARILSIADAFDAIRSSRPYKSSFGLDDSLELLRTQAGNSYDPRLVELFIQHIDELEAVANDAGRNISELSFRRYFENVDSAILKADASTAESMLPMAASEGLVHLFEFCTGVGRVLGFLDCLPILTRRLKQIVPYSTCAIYICQDDDSVKTEYVCGEFADSLLGMRIRLGKGISGWVAAYKRPMINTRPALEFEGMEGDFSSLNDALVVPLVRDGECTGTLSLYAREACFYSQTHLSLLQTVADQVTPLVRESISALTPESNGLLDPVTGIHRVAYLSVAGAQMLSHAENTDSPLSLLSLEVRNFPQSVALFGAATGDLILRRVADILRAELRQTDILVRFGHYGFVALLPGVSGPQAFRYVHRLQQLIKSTPINLAPGNTFFINCPAAIASYPNDGSTLLALLQAAQRGLADQARLSGPQVAGSEGNVLEFPPRI
jgi:diguanylate cyclase (GGDEF)-like protein/putative nucleotidyltransferase with HDIG domain